MKHRTTEHLREMLFDTIDKIKSGQMDFQEAKAVSDLAGRIVQSAELELKYSEIMLKLRKEDDELSAGPVLLTQKRPEDIS